jgi:alkylhydroperoxidase/carboxymuconolactone decarboxylase family protein YurZ
MTSVYPASTPEVARKRRELTPGQSEAFQAFSKAVFADGALSAKFKQIVAVAVAHVTQCLTVFRATQRRRCGPERPRRS